MQHAQSSCDNPTPRRMLHPCQLTQPVSASQLHAKIRTLHQYGSYCTALPSLAISTDHFNTSRQPRPIHLLCLQGTARIYPLNHLSCLRHNEERARRLAYLPRKVRTHSDCPQSVRSRMRESASLRCRSFKARACDRQEAEVLELRYESESQSDLSTRRGFRRGRVARTPLALKPFLASCSHTEFSEIRG